MVTEWISKFYFLSSWTSLDVFLSAFILIDSYFHLEGQIFKALIRRIFFSVVRYLQSKFLLGNISLWRRGKHYTCIVTVVILNIIPSWKLLKHKALLCDSLRATVLAWYLFLVPRLLGKVPDAPFIFEVPYRSIGELPVPKWKVEPQQVMCSNPNVDKGLFMEKFIRTKIIFLW